jgi:hypothetical protein
LKSVLEVSGISIAPLELGVVERQRSTTSEGSAPGTFVRSRGSFIKHLGRAVMNNEPKSQTRNHASCAQSRSASCLKSLQAKMRQKGKLPYAGKIDVSPSLE